MLVVSLQPVEARGREHIPGKLALSWTDNGQLSTTVLGISGGRMMEEQLGVWAGVPGNWGTAWNALSMCPVCFVNPRSMREQDMAHVCAVCAGATGAG